MLPRSVKKEIPCPTQFLLLGPTVSFQNTRKTRVGGQICFRPAQRLTRASPRDRPSPLHLTSEYHLQRGTPAQFQRQMERLNSNLPMVDPENTSIQKAKRKRKKKKFSEMNPTQQEKVRVRRRNRRSLNRWTAKVITRYQRSHEVDSAAEPGWSVLVRWMHAEFRDVIESLREVSSKNVSELSDYFQGKYGWEIVLVNVVSYVLEHPDVLEVHALDCAQLIYRVLRVGTNVNHRNLIDANCTIVICVGLEKFYSIQMVDLCCDMMLNLLKIPYFKNGYRHVKACNTFSTNRKKLKNLGLLKVQTVFQKIAALGFPSLFCV